MASKTKKKAKHKKVGRKPWKPTKAQVTKAVELKKYFATNKMVCTALGISHTTLASYKEKNPEFAKLLANSSEETVFNAGMEMTKLALEKKQYLPLAFVLKAKGGWMDDGAQTETTDSKLNIQFIDDDEPTKE